MSRVRVKICGITRPQDAISAAESGADAIGLVFYENSSRCVDIDKAKTIVASIPPFICKVGLFVDHSDEVIDSILENVPLDLLQFHGNESPDQCRRFGKSYIKAIRMDDDVDITELVRNYHDAAALLLDTYIEGMVGGSGQTFDWSRVPSKIAKPIILAGGLDVNNVIAAIRQVNPYAVDVSGGVESDKGIKDKQKIAAFVRVVSNA